jgi:hypothetical protein
MVLIDTATARVNNLVVDISFITLIMQLLEKPSRLLQTQENVGTPNKTLHQYLPTWTRVL